MVTSTLEGTTVPRKTVPSMLFRGQMATVREHDPSLACGLIQAAVLTIVCEPLLRATETHSPAARGLMLLGYYSVINFCFADG